MKHILIIGGLGNLGSRLNEYLLSKNYKVSILDRRDCILSEKNNQTQASALFYFENNKFFNQSGSQVETDELLGITDVIVATRYRESTENNYDKHPWSQDSISQISLSFEYNIVNPIKVIYELTSNTENYKMKNIIHIFSSNAFQISQQSLSYHLINSAIPMLGKYISVLHDEIDLNYFLMEIGVIGFNDSQETSRKIQNPGFSGLNLNEFSTVVEFLIEKSPRYLSGQVISLTGGRKFLDSTAAYEGVFGDLSVRKKVE